MTFSSFMMRFLIFALTLCSLGVPYDQLWKIWLLPLLFIIIFFFQWRTPEYKKKWPMVAFLAVGCFVIHIIPTYKIEEGHQVFRFDQKQDVYKDFLPSKVYNFMHQKVMQENPKGSWCSASDPDINYKPFWTCFPSLGMNHLESVQRPISFHNDRFWSHPKFSRIVSNISFKSLRTLRPGFFFSVVSKDGYLNIYNGRWARDQMPFYVFYEINREMIGDHFFSTLPMYLENTKITENVFNIESKDVGKRLFFLSLDKKPFQVELKKKSVFFDALKVILSLIFVFFSLFKLYSYPNTFKEFQWKFWKTESTSLQLIVIFVLSLIPLSKELHNFTFPRLPGGGDGLTHYGHGRIILEELTLGNWREVFRGGTDQFYYMPGQRYFNALSMIFFGDSLGANLIIALLYLMTFYQLSIFFLKRQWGYWISILFIFCSGIYGFDFIIKLSRDNLPESLGYLLFLQGILLLTRHYQKENTFKGSYFFWVVLGLSLFFRPNLSLGFAFFVLILFFKHCILNRNYRDTIYPLFGLPVVFLACFHNFFFSGEFTLFTISSFISANYQTPLSVYGKALKSLFFFRIDENVIQSIYHMGRWSIGNGLLFPLFFIGHIFFLVFKRRAYDFSLNLLAWTGIGLHTILLFWIPHGRYSLPAWYISILVTLRCLQNLKNNPLKKIGLYGNLATKQK